MCCPKASVLILLRPILLRLACCTMSDLDGRHGLACFFCSNLTRLRRTACLIFSGSRGGRLSGRLLCAFPLASFNHSRSIQFVLFILCGRVAHSAFLDDMSEVCLWREYDNEDLHPGVRLTLLWPVPQFGKVLLRSVRVVIAVTRWMR